MFQFKEGDPIKGWRLKDPSQERKQKRLEFILDFLKTQEISFPCENCENYQRCQDKFALLILGNGSINSLLARKNKEQKNSERYCPPLFIGLEQANKKYKEFPKLKKDYEDFIFQTL